MTFVGIGGQAPGGDYAGFVERTGTGGFTQLVDDDAGSLWEQFGADGRATFFFVNDDGTFEQTAFGVIDEATLEAEVERLLSS